MSEDPAQVRHKTLPVPPGPTQSQAAVFVAPIAEPEAAKSRKAGAAKGEVRSAGAKRKKRKEPKAVAARAKDLKMKSSKRKEKMGRSWPATR
jgi:hypothetical protein